MKFNKILLSGLVLLTGAVNSSEIAPVDKSPEQKQFEQIRDALKVLPPIENYLTKMQDIEKRYENVFKPLSKPETELRIKNAKEKAIQFYAEIFGVKLREIEEYRENFTTEQHLTWIAKETIENGKYSFADNEEDLFGGEADSDDICVPLNDPYLETMIVHETGHIIHEEYKKRYKLTRLHDNRLTEAVATFFETCYTMWTNDPTHNLIRLSDFYHITFKQSFSKKIRERGNQDRMANKEIYTKVQDLFNLKELSNDGFPINAICGYRPSHRWEDEQNQNLTEDAKTRNYSELNYKNYIFKNFPELKFVYDMWEEHKSELGLKKLPLNVLIPGLGSVSEDLRSFLEDYLGAKSNYTDYDYGTIYDYISYVPHVYWTLKRGKLIPGKDVVEALDKIVRNVPPMMTKNELEDFTKMLELK